MMEISKDDFWTTNIHPGHIKVIKVGNLNSKHLANIIHFFTICGPNVHGHSYEECSVIVEGMIKIAQDRGLSQEFIKGAPYPYDPASPYEEYKEEEIRHE